MNDPQTARRAYFSAADRAPLEGGRPTANQTTTASTRQQLAQDLISKAEHVAAAVKTARAFDTTGHMLDAIPHLETAVQDLIAAHVSLVADVTRFIGKTGSRGRLERGLALAAAAEQGTPAGTHAEALQRTFERRPAGSALAAVDAAEAAVAGEPPLPAPLSGPYTHPSMPGPYPKPAAPYVRKLADRPQA